MRFAGTCPTTGSPSCWPRATSTSCRSRRGLGQGQRAVEDVLDPRRRPAGRRGDRRGHRGAPPARRRPAAASPCAPDDPDAFVAAVGAARRRRRAGRRDGRAGRAVGRSARRRRRPSPRRTRRWSPGSPTAPGAGRSRRPAGSIAPSWLPHRRRRRPPSWPRRARARRSASRAARCSRCRRWRILVLGLATIVYARASRSPSADASPPHDPTTTGTPPTASSVRRARVRQLTGDLEERDSTGQLIEQATSCAPACTATTTASSTGTPFTSAATGEQRHARGVPRQLRRRARPTIELEVPASNQRGGRRTRSTTRARPSADGEDAELRSWSGTSSTDTEQRQVVHRRLQRHPDRQGRPRVHDRLRARRHRHRDAAVGRRPAERSARSTRAPSRPVDSVGRTHAPDGSADADRAPTVAGRAGGRARPTTTVAAPRRGRHRPRPGG